MIARLILDVCNGVLWLSAVLRTENLARGGKLRVSKM